jgi:glycosyltransferase involved in cell wall biosynthesis
VKRGVVSTIIPVFNRAQMLREAVDSVLKQTYRPLEIIVVDDGSTDDTLAVAFDLASSNPELIKVERQPNSGPGAARNLGLARASGEFVQYLDSDDLLEPGKFECQVRALREHPQAGMAYGLSRRVDLSTGRSRVWARTDELIESLFPDFLMKRGWDTNSPLWRRSTCDAIGAWSDFRCMEDWEHDLKAGMLGMLPVRVQEHVATVRDHPQARASGMHTGFTPELTRDFFRAHRAIWQRMSELGLTDWSYLREFSRKLFWIARMCGERGLIAEADEALGMAEQMAGTHHLSMEIRIFRAMVRLLGWGRAVKLSEAARTLSRTGPETSLA